MVPTQPTAWTTAAQPFAPPEVVTVDPKRQSRGLTALRVDLLHAGQRPALKTGARVRANLEAMGGSWRGLAVFLSSRYDLFDPVFADQIALTRVSATPLDAETIAEIFQQDFNRPLDSLLADFDPRPIWVGGLSELHEATLRHTGERVWVQVQRPDAAARAAADAAALEKLCKTLSQSGTLKYAPWSRNVRELKSQLANHVDYRFTAYQMARQWARWRRQPGAHAPKVFRNYCSKRVIIAERIDGVPLSRALAERCVNPDGVAAWFEANGINPRKLARRMYKSFLRDLIEHGTCHIELDPSRILLLKNSHFGIVPGPLPPIVQVEADRVRAFRGLVRHLPQREYSSAYTDVLGLVEPLPAIDPVELKKYITRDLRAWGQRDAVRTLPGGERTLSSLFFDIACLFRERKIVFDVNVAMALRALRVMEDSVKVLHPRLRRLRLLQRFFNRSVQRMARAATRTSARVASMTGPTPVNTDLPYDMLDQTERNAEAISEQSLQFANTASKPAFLFEKVFSALRFLAGLGGVAIVLLFVDQEIVRMDALRNDRAGRFLTIAPQLTWLDFVVWFVADVWLFLLFHRITRRFRARDSALPRHDLV